MKKIKKFKEFINEGFIDSKAASIIGSIVTGKRMTEYPEDAESADTYSSYGQDTSSTPANFNYQKGKYESTYSDSIEKQASSILRKEEGFITYPMWDVNNWRTGYGSSTITKSDGSVINLPNDSTKKPNITITKEDAERDLLRRLTEEFIPQVKKSLGKAADKLNNGTLAAIVSVCYNYGHVPKSVVSAAQTGDANQIANAISALGNSSSIHKGRRDREASWVLGSVGVYPSFQDIPIVKGEHKSIVIGDSLVPYVAKGAGVSEGPKAKDIKNSGKNGLWFGGIAVGSLLTFSKDYKNIDPAVKNVIISIGTNGIFGRSTKTIKELISRLKVLFPNAKILVVRGSYGSKLTAYPALQTVKQSTVDAFYSDFTDNGATVIPTPVGNVIDPHGHLPVYKVIGKEIQQRLQQ